MNGDMQQVRGIELFLQEFIVDDENQGEVIKKSTVDYHPGKVSYRIMDKFE